MVTQNLIRVPGPIRPLTRDDIARVEKRKQWVIAGTTLDAMNLSTEKADAIAQVRNIAKLSGLIETASVAPDQLLDTVAIAAAERITGLSRGHRAALRGGTAEDAAALRNFGDTYQLCLENIQHAVSLLGSNNVAGLIRHQLKHA